MHWVLRATVIIELHMFTLPSAFIWNDTYENSYTNNKNEFVKPVSNNKIFNKTFRKTWNTMPYNQLVK